MEAGLGTIKVGEGDKFDTGPVQSLPQLEKPLGVGPKPLAYREGVMVQPEAVASLGPSLAVEPVDDRYSELLEAIARVTKLIYKTTWRLVRLMSVVEAEVSC